MAPSSLDALKEEYRADLPSIIASLAERLRTQLDAAYSPQAWSDLHRAVHGLAGTSATFGFLEISERARDLEAVIKAIQEEGAAPTSSRRDDVLGALDSLLGKSPRAAAARQPAKAAARGGPQLWEPIAPTPPPADKGRLVYILEDDPRQAKTLSEQIAGFGYKATCFDRLQPFGQALADSRPDVIVADVVFPEGDLAGPQFIARCQATMKPPVPVIFTSVRGDLEARLAAARAGAKAYFVKPVNISELTGWIDQFARPVPSDPYRVLVVDDETALAAYYVQVLRQAGLEALAVSDPLKVMGPLSEFRPELIIMDVYMPGCNGVELAASIRQLEAYAAIPILFLSTEASLDRKLKALKFGGDDFLTKPIEPQQLVLAVSTRAERGRFLRSLMVRDSLTGLLSETALKDILAIEVPRAARYHNSVALILMEIDGLEAIRKHFGHTALDRTHKALAWVLRQRLRKSDVLSRGARGGSALLLPHTDKAGAGKVIESVQADFSNAVIQSESKPFKTAFCAGAAIFPEFGNPAALLAAADYVVAMSGDPVAGTVHRGWREWRLSAWRCQLITQEGRRDGGLLPLTKRCSAPLGEESF